MSKLNFIRPASVSDDYKIAILHQEELKNSFLANTGIQFLTMLYSSLIKKEHVLIYEEKNIIKGFVSFSTARTSFSFIY